MTTTVETQPLLRDLDVLNWRYECLEDAGYPTAVAVMLAERPDIDLHLACELLERGATLRDALRILI